MSDFPLHGFPLSLLQADLSGDGDVRLLLSTCLEINDQGLNAPEEMREEGVRLRYYFPTNRGQCNVMLKLEETMMGGVGVCVETSTLIMRA